MIDCLSVFYQKMASRQISSVKSQTAPWSFTRALASALYEWALICMLLINAIFSYFITRFADYSGLQSPCLFCSRLDHILGNKRLRHYWDLVCSKHKSEISSLVYCHTHHKLVDVHGMCESCLFSFATMNKSNAETYRLLVGKLGEDSSPGFENDSSYSSVSISTRYCTCCNQPWVPRGYAQVAEPEVPFKIPSVVAVGHWRAEKQTAQVQDMRKKKVRFYHSPHVGYTQLKIHSDTESEAALSDDDDDDGFSEDYRFQTVELEPRVITLPYDLPTEKLIDPVSASEPSNPAKLQEIDFEKKPTLVPELDSLHHVPETSDSVELSADALDEKGPISFNNVPSTSNTLKLAADVTKESELISLEAVASSEAREVPADVIKERELIYLHDVCLTSDATEHSADVPAQSDAKETPTNVLMETTELLSLNDAPTTLAPWESPEDVLKETELVSLDIISTSEAREDSIFISVGEVPQSLTKKDIPFQLSNNSETTLVDDVLPVSESLFSSSEAVELVAEVATIECETKSVEAEEKYFTEIDELRVVSDENNATEIAPETNNPSSVPSVAATAPEADPSVSEAAFKSKLCSVTSTWHVREMASEPGETKSIETEEKYFTENDELCIVRDESNATEIAPETNNLSSVPSVAATAPEAAFESNSCLVDSTLHVREIGSETDVSLMQAGDALDLTDAYKIAVCNSGKQQSSGVQTEQWTGKESSRVSEDLKALLTQISASRGIELLSPRDTSPKISVNSDEMKSLDDMHLLLQKRMLERNESNLSLDGVVVGEIEGESETDRLKRQVDHDWKLLTGLYKELEEERSASAVAANQAMAMMTRLQEEKASLQMEALQNLRMLEEQAEYDMEAIQKLNDLLAEREKEIQDLEAELEFYQNQSPSASTAVNKVTQPERSDISENPGHMEPIQNLNDLLSEREKQIQDLKAELEFYHNQSPSALKGLNATEQPGRSKISVNPGESEKEDFAEKVVEADISQKNMSNLIQNSLLGFEVERIYITDCLEKIEKKLHLSSSDVIHADTSNGEYSAEGEEAYDPKDVNIETDKSHSPVQEHVSLYEKTRNMVSVEDEVSELHERLETLKGDLYFLEHVIKSLDYGNEGMQFIKEIASHLQTLRSLSVQGPEQLKPH